MSAQVIRYTVSQPADGSDFEVDIVPPQPDTNYGLTAELVKGDRIAKVETPDDQFAVDTFRVRTSAPLASGDVVEIILVHA